MSRVADKFLRFDITVTITTAIKIFNIKTSEKIVPRFDIIFNASLKKVTRTLHIRSKITHENMKSDKNMEICTKR